MQATPILRQTHLISLLIDIGHHENILRGLRILYLARFRLILESLIHLENLWRLVLAAEGWSKIKFCRGFSVKKTLIKLSSAITYFLTIVLDTRILDGFIGLLLLLCWWFFIISLYFPLFQLLLGRRPKQLKLFEAIGSFIELNEQFFFRQWGLQRLRCMII